MPDTRPAGKRSEFKLQKEPIWPQVHADGLAGNLQLKEPHMEALDRALIEKFEAQDSELRALWLQHQDYEKIDRKARRQAFPKPCGRARDQGA